MILVVGSTGVLGMEICKRLRESGVSVRGLVRQPSRREPELAELGVEIVYGDLKDPSSIKDACQGVDCVVSTANAMMSRRRGDSLKAVDQVGQLGLVRAAREAGVSHFVFTSVTPNSVDCTFVRYKREVERALRESGMTWTVLQPSAFMEVAFSPIAGWDMEKGKIRVVGAGQRPISFISLHDVAEYTVMATQRPEMQGRTLPLGGPEPLTIMDAVGVFEEATGKTLKVERAPRLLLKAASVLLRPVHPPLSMILAFASSDRDDVIDMAPVLSEFPVKLTSLREFAARG